MSDPADDPAAIAQLKSRLRMRLLAARRDRTQAEIDAARAAIAANVLARFASTDGGWGCAAAYVPLRTEPGSPALLDGLTRAGVRVLVPLLLPDRDLDWTTWPADGGSALGPAAIGSAEVVFVPALAADPRGTRLGRGGGSYDRALRRVMAGTPVVALLYDDELLAEVPAAPWDLPISAVVTPSGWHELAP